MSRWLAGAVALTLTLLVGAAEAAEPPRRIASLNMCADQLLVALADPATIIGLSPYARDLGRSWVASQVQTLPKLSGGAEDILMLRPDLVLVSQLNSRATIDLLRGQGIRVEQLKFVTSINDVRQQIIDVGRLVGHVAEAEVQVASIDAALARLKAVAAQKHLRVLPFARRGWVTGSKTLLSDILLAAGLINAGDELAISGGGFVSLEQVAFLKADALVVGRAEGGAEDQGQAMLQHPVIEHLFPPERRIVIPERLTICGGVMLAEAMDALATQLLQLPPQR